jgi:carbamoylphosphate synthase large subunit
MPQPNIAAPTNVAGKNDVLAVTTTATAITANSNAGACLHSESLTVCNVSNATATLTVDLYDGTTATEICVIPIGAQQMIEIIKKESPKKILPDQSIRLTASVDNALKAVHTYLEIT